MRMKSFFQVVLWNNAFILLLLFSFFSYPTSVRADDIRTAKRIYIEGMRFYNQKRYAEAAVQLALADHLLPKTKRYQRAHQKLSYYLGVCYYQTKKWRKAEHFLKRYLSHQPRQAEKETNAKRLLIEVQKQIAALPKEKPKVKVKVKVITKSKVKVKTKIVKVVKVKIVKVKEKVPKAYWQPFPFIVAGVGLLTLATGGVVGAFFQGKLKERDDSYNNLLANAPKDLPPPAKNITLLHQQAQTLATTANVLFIAGGAITLIGGVLILTIGKVQPKLPPKTHSPKIPKSTLFNAKNSHFYRKNLPLFVR